MMLGARPILARFNSSVGILFIQARRPAARGSAVKWFQFLSRNSLHSSEVEGAGSKVKSCCFNSSVGILFIQAKKSMGWSGTFLGGFNSSVGILFIQAGNVVGVEENDGLVSIPQSEFSSFKQCFELHSADTGVRFQFLSRNSLHSSPRGGLGVVFMARCFNSSVGILFIQARDTMLISALLRSVSIPQSEFSSFKLWVLIQVAQAVGVSIPQSEFSSFKRGRVDPYPRGSL